jgi:uncharacterized protein with von Willebrand factor type A (vWA) domain
VIAVEADLADVVARFGQLLHRAGVPVTPERAARLASAMTLSFPTGTSELYWMARVTLLGDHSQIGIFDRIFASVFGGLVDPAAFRGQSSGTPAASGRATPLPPDPAAAVRRSERPGPSVLADEDGREVDASGTAPPHSLAATFSPDERLRQKDFAAMTPDELALVRDLAGRFAFATPPRSSRRRQRSPKGPDLDVRAVLRHARRSAGEPVTSVRRRRRQRPRRLVLICDISGSMEPYTRAYLELLMSGVAGASAEAFVFATRLTRLTRALRGVTPSVALDRAARAAPDWAGGTRIGEALKTFNDEHGQRGVARGAVVVVLSDGWDCGDAQVLGREMARLARLASRIVWVNPRKAAPAFQPLAGGMAAALPHTDAFVSGHSLAALDEVLAAISG